MTINRLRYIDKLKQNIFGKENLSECKTSYFYLDAKKEIFEDLQDAINRKLGKVKFYGPQEEGKHIDISFINKKYQISLSFGVNVANLAIEEMKMIYFKKHITTP